MLPNEVFALACRERYAEDGLVVDESNGEFAHCPLPEGLGETGYYLLHDDHQWQGLLQSRDVGRRCYWVGHAKRWLETCNFVDGYFDLWDIYDEFNKLSEEHKRKLRGVNNFMYGKSHSEETRRKIREALKGLPGRPGRPGIPHSEEHRRKISEAQIGERNTNFGKRGRYNHLSKPIIATKPCGSEVRYESITEAQRELGSNNLDKSLKKTKIVTRGKFKGWQFRYA